MYFMSYTVYQKITMPPSLMLCCNRKPPLQCTSHEVILIHSYQPGPVLSFLVESKCSNTTIPTGIRGIIHAIFEEGSSLSESAVWNDRGEFDHPRPANPWICLSIYHTKYRSSQPFLLFPLPHRQYVIFVTIVLIPIIVTLIHPY